MTRLVRAFLKVLFGTLVYVVLVYLAAPLPVAAGTMLTFPALNGLALLYEDRSRANAIAGTMLFMPVVNGLLCAFFIFAYWFWSRATWADEFAVALLTVVALLWAAFFYLLRRAAGVPDQHHIWYVLGCTIVFIAAALLVVRSMPALAAQALPQSRPGAVAIFSMQGMQEVLVANNLRIALFVGALALFVILTEYFNLPSNIKGFLGGFPVVPFGGLLTIALARPAGFDLHVATFSAMAAGVWLSPVVPVWFIYGYSRYLSGTPAPIFARFGVLVIAWAACFLAIVAVSQWTFVAGAPS